MSNYKITQRIVTLAENAVFEDDKKPASFIQDDIEFTHWDFNYRDGWLSRQWQTEMTLDSNNHADALKEFHKKLQRIIPRIALIGQCYIDFLTQPILILKSGVDYGLFRFVSNRNPVGLMFDEKSKKALTSLLHDDTVPEEFYYYWNDAVNALGYTAKLLLMFSAIEALSKKNGKKDWELIEKILGKELTEEIFGTPKSPGDGLRHRLVHGEYLNRRDYGKNYLEEIHKKIVVFFNSNIFSESLITENVVNPQRHFFDNKEGGWFFVKDKQGGVILFKSLIDDFENNDINKLKQFEILYDYKQLVANY